MKRLILYILVTLTIGFAPSLITNGHAYWPSDFFEQQIPFILEAKRMLASGTPYWSWNTGLGCNFIGAYAFYTLTSPFVWINTLFPVEYIGLGVSLTLILKFIITGILAYLYMRNIGLNTALSQSGALLFTFSSYIISNLYYYHFFEPVIGFLLLIISLESLLRHKRYAYTKVALSAFAAAWLNFYFLPATCLSCLIYMIIRSRRNGGAGIVAKASVFTIIGILTASAILLPAIMHLSGSSRAVPHLNLIFNYALQIPARIASIFLPKLTESSAGIYGILGRFSSTAAFLPVLGASLWLPFAIYYRKRGYGAITIVLLIIFLTPLQGIFTLFTSPSYNRWLYGFTLITATASCLYLNEWDKHLIKPSGRWILIYTSLTIAILISLMIYSHVKQPDNIDYGIFSIAAFSIINLIFLIIFIRKHNLNILNCGIILTAGLQICTNIYISQYGSDEIDFQNLEPITANHNNITFTGKRTEYISAHGNTSLLYNAPGTHSFISTYGSAANELYDLYEENRPTSNYIGFKKMRGSFYSLLSVERIIRTTDHCSNTENILPDSTRFSEETEKGLIITYINRNCIPLGTAYDSYITEEDIIGAIAGDSSFNAADAMLASLAVKQKDESIFKRYLKKSTINRNTEIDSASNARKKLCVTDFTGTSQGFEAKFQSCKSATLFFSVPFDEGFSAFIDRQPTEIYSVNFGLCAIIIPAGEHCIEFRYFPPGLKTGLALSALGLIMIIVTSLWEDRKLHTHKSSYPDKDLNRPDTNHKY